jgi:transposase
LVPREDSTGGNRGSGRSRNRAIAICDAFWWSEPARYARQQPEKYPWLTQLLARKPFKVVAVALANKMARIAWALLAKGDTYQAAALAAAA